LLQLAHRRAPRIGDPVLDRVPIVGPSDDERRRPPKRPCAVRAQERGAQARVRTQLLTEGGHLAHPARRTIELFAREIVKALPAEWPPAFDRRKRGRRIGERARERTSEIDESAYGAIAGARIGDSRRSDGARTR